MMLTLVLADRSTIRVESCPVPVLLGFEEWRVYAHHLITEDGVDESNWVATEARTVHQFPGIYRSPELASRAAMARLQKWGKQHAASTFIRATKRLARLGIDFPVNDVGNVSLPAPERIHKENARLWRVLDVLQMSSPLTVYEIAKSFPQCTVGQIQSSIRALRSMGIVSRIGPHMSSRYCVEKRVAA